MHILQMSYSSITYPPSHLKQNVNKLIHWVIILPFQVYLQWYGI